MENIYEDITLAGYIREIPKDTVWKNIYQFIKKNQTNVKNGIENHVNIIVEDQVRGTTFNMLRWKPFCVKQINKSSILKSLQQ